MTSEPSKQTHCDHECVCPDYKASHSDWEEEPDPCTMSCMQRASHSSANEPVTVPEYTGRHPHYILVEKARKQARAEVLDAIERFTFTCMWFNATDCPGASNGECICDDCERFEYSSPEDVRNYIKFLQQQEGKP